MTNNVTVVLYVDKLCLKHLLIIIFSLVIIVDMCIVKSRESSS